MSTKVVEPTSGGQSNHPEPVSSRSFPCGIDPKRIYSALIFIPLFYLLTRHLPPVVFFVLIGTTVLIAQWEFLRLLIPERALLGHVIVGMPGTLLLLSAMQWPTAISFHLALLMTLTAFLVYQVGYAPLGTSHLSMVVLLFGMIYIGYTLGHLLWLRNLKDGAFLVFFVLWVTWAGDTAAYFIGTLWGRRPLAPQLSPQKTLEGLLGSLVVAPIMAWVGHIWFLPMITSLDCLVLGLLLTMLGVVGDLSESALKRHVGIKDTSSLIPGHGGIFDRVDSLLLSVPAFYYYVAFVKGLS